MGGHVPVLVAKSGDTVETWTLDSHGVDKSGRQRAGVPNPLTGPIAVEGAEEGDSLGVFIEELAPNRESCWSHGAISPDLLTTEHLSRFPDMLNAQTGADRYIDWHIDRSAGVVRPAGRTGPEVPLAPMLGCIGTAPPGGQVISTATSGSYGGNMDYVGVARGAWLYFPVYAPQALLYLGDGHATQSHGEIGGAGTEVSMNVRIRLKLLKGRPIGWPRGINSSYLFTLGNGRPLELALQRATSELVFWLTEHMGMEDSFVRLLLTQAAEYEIANVFDPAYTVVCKIARTLLPADKRNGGLE